MATAPRSGGADESGGGELMLAAELKPLLNLSKRQPVSCVVAFLRDKTAIVVLDKKVKPKKLAAQVKRDAAGKKLELDAGSVRFGRAAVDAQGDGSLVVFTLSKPPPGGMQQKVLAKIKPAGFQKCDFRVDGAIEAEAEDDGPDAGGGRAEAGGPGGTRAADGTGGAAEPAGGQAGARPEPEAPGPEAPEVAPSSPDGRGAAAEAGAGADAGGADTPAPGAAAGPDRLSLTRRLTALVPRIAGAGASDPARRVALSKVALAAQASLKSGDLAAAGQGVDKLEAMLGGALMGGPGMAGPGGDAAPGASDPAEAGAGANVPASQAAAPPAAPGAAAAQSPAPAASPPAQAVAVDSPPAQAAVNAPAGGSARMRHGSPVFEKGRQTWLGIMKSVERDIEAVSKGFEQHVGAGSEDAAIIRGNFATVLHGLDGALASKLEEVSKNPDGAAHGKLVGEAREIIGRYKAFVDADPAVRMLDENPVHPVTVRKTLGAALTTLLGVVGADAGGAPPGGGQPSSAAGQA